MALHKSFNLLKNWLEFDVRIDASVVASKKEIIKNISQATSLKINMSKTIIEIFTTPKRIFNNDAEKEDYEHVYLFNILCLFASDHLMEIIYYLNRLETLDIGHYSIFLSSFQAPIKLNSLKLFDIIALNELSNDSFQEITELHIEYFNTSMINEALLDSFRDFRNLQILIIDVLGFYYEASPENFVKILQVLPYIRSVKFQEVHMQIFSDTPEDSFATNYTDHIYKALEIKIAQNEENSLIKVAI